MQYAAQMNMVMMQRRQNISNEADACVRTPSCVEEAYHLTLLPMLLPGDLMVQDDCCIIQCVKCIKRLGGDLSEQSQMLSVEILTGKRASVKAQVALRSVLCIFGATAKPA